MTLGNDEPDASTRNMTIPESDIVPRASEVPRSRTLRERNALSKHKVNFFTSSLTPGEESAFFDRNFAAINQQQVSRVKHKFL